MAHSLLPCLKYCNVLFNFVFSSQLLTVLTYMQIFNEYLKKIFNSFEFDARIHYSVKKVYLGYSGVVIGRMMRIDPQSFFLLIFFYFLLF